MVQHVALRRTSMIKDRIEGHTRESGFDRQTLSRAVHRVVVVRLVERGVALRTRGSPGVSLRCQLEFCASVAVASHRQRANTCLKRSCSSFTFSFIPPDIY